MRIIEIEVDGYTAIKFSRSGTARVKVAALASIDFGVVGKDWFELFKSEKDFDPSLALYWHEEEAGPISFSLELSPDDIFHLLMWNSNEDKKAIVAFDIDYLN